MELPYERKTWKVGCSVGNAIIEFKGVEHLKAWKLTQTSPPIFVVCKNCHTNFFERNPPHKPHVFTIPSGSNVWESKI